MRWIQDYSAEGTPWCSSVDVYSLWADFSRKSLHIWIIFTKMKYFSSSDLAESSCSTGFLDALRCFFPTAWILGRACNSGPQGQTFLLGRIPFPVRERGWLLGVSHRKMHWRTRLQGTIPVPGRTWCALTPGLVLFLSHLHPGNILILTSKSRQSTYHRWAGNCSDRVQTLCVDTTGIPALAGVWKKVSLSSRFRSFPESLPMSGAAGKLQVAFPLLPGHQGLGIVCCKCHLW